MKERLQFNVAVRHFRQLKNAIAIPKYCTITNKHIGYKDAIERESELTEFYLTIPKLPMTKSSFEDGWEQLGRRLKEELISKGYMEKNFL